MKINLRKLFSLLAVSISMFAFAQIASAGGYNDFGYGGYYGGNTFSFAVPQTQSSATSYASAGPGGATAYSNADTNSGYSPYGFGGSSDATSYASAGPGGATAYSNANYSQPTGYVNNWGWNGWGNNGGCGHHCNTGCNDGCLPRPPHVVQPQPCGYDWGRWSRQFSW
jgi:hypothetical protein